MRLFLRLLPLLALISTRVVAAEASLLDTLAAETARMDQMTGTEVTLNHVQLLHLGKASMPARLQLVRNAQKYIFISVPYWFNDVTGNQMFRAIQARANQVTNIDLRVLEDWTSPGSTGDLLGLNMFHRLKKLTEGDAMLWNTPYWGRSFSWSILKNRLHDKFFLVDGDKLIMGGMNIGDEYMLGGSARKGWHDTDVLIEGPAAAAAGRAFLKIWNFSRYMEDPGNRFPHGHAARRQALSNFLYRERETFDESEDGRMLAARGDEVQIPIHADFRKFGLAKDQQRGRDGGVPVRILYDNPLFNQPLSKESARPYCRFECVLNYMLQRTHRTVRIFMPYLTLTDQQEKVLVNAAERGLKIELITNSSQSHDLGKIAYYAAVSHYEALLDAGVKIYEWQGNKPLEALERGHGCRIPESEFPGKTIHTKAVILDDQVGIIGSNNMNVRSDLYNSEAMAIVYDPGFAAQLNQVFDHDLDLDQAGRRIRCGSKMVTRPRLVRPAVAELVHEFVRRNKIAIALARGLQNLF